MDNVRKIGDMFCKPDPGKEPSPMSMAYQEGKVENKRYLDGEITESEYEQRKQEIMTKHGI